VRHGLVVDQHLGRIVAADDLKEIAQRDGVLGIKAGPMAQPIAGAKLAVLPPKRAPSPRPSRNPPR